MQQLMYNDIGLQRHASVKFHRSGEMNLTPLPEVARPWRLVECVGNYNSSYLIYNSDMCRTTSVSGVGDQTRESYIAAYNAKNTASLVACVV